MTVYARSVDGSAGGTARKPRTSVVVDRLKRFVDSENIVELLDDDEVEKIGGRVLEDYERDEASNEDWRQTAERALDVAMQTKEAKNYPFPGASNVKWPLVTVAALQFNARAYPAIVDGDNIVKAKVVGSDKGIPKAQQATPAAQPPGMGMPQSGMMPPAGGVPMSPGGGAEPGAMPAPEQQWEVEPGSKRAKADRISKHMSYQLTEEMTEWEEDTDTLLIQLPIVGTAFRKVSYDPVLGRNKAEMVAGTDVVVHRKTTTLERAPRITHILRFYPNEIQEKQAQGIWDEGFEAGEAQGADGDDDAPHVFLEQHRPLDLDGDGYREPYIVMVHKDSGKVVRIVANYALDDIKMGAERVLRIQRREYFVKYGFIPDPKGGFYDIGFGRLLESLGAAIDTTINQMLDAGHLQNAGGGFIGSGVRLKKAEQIVVPGRYVTVNSTGASLREAIVPHNFPGPSAVLFNLLGLMLDAAKNITAVQDVLTGDGKDANQTATTTLALIEQGMKVFTAIYKRIYRSLKQEFKLLFRLNAEYLPEESYFTVLDEEQAVARADYDVASYDVCPQADPRLVTDMQRIARAQLVTQYLGTGLLDDQEALTRFFRAVGEEDVEKLFAKPSPPNPVLMAAQQAELRGLNAKAAKDETQAMKNVADIEDKGKNTQMKAIDMMRNEEGSARASDREERAMRQQAVAV